MYVFLLLIYAIHSLILKLRVVYRYVLSNPKVNVNIFIYIR